MAQIQDKKRPRAKAIGAGLDGALCWGARMSGGAGSKMLCNRSQQHFQFVGLNAVGSH
jgi:hypothetical protein